MTIVMFPINNLVRELQYDSEYNIGSHILSFVKERRIVGKIHLEVYDRRT